MLGLLTVIGAWSFLMMVIHLCIQHEERTRSRDADEHWESVIR